MWELKLLGCIIVIGTLGAVGIKAAEKLKARVKILLELIGAIDRIAQYIKLENEDIESILSRTLPKGITFDAEGVIAENRIAVSGEDISLLNEFLGQLGMGDKVSETVKCSSYKQLFIKQREEAERDVEEKYRLYSTIGFICGIILSFLWW